MRGVNQALTGQAAAPPRGRRPSAPLAETDPNDPALVALATKIVRRSTIGRRWYFHNGVCVAFFRASAEADGVRA